VSTTFVPSGPQFVVNGSILGLQMDVDLAALDTGGYVAVWTHQSGSITEIRGQIFDAGGLLVRSELRLTSDLSGAQTRADVTALSEGGFAVTYTSSHSGTAAGVFAQFFDASAVATSDVIGVNSTPNKTHFESVAATLTNGDVVFAYTGLGRDGSNMGVFAQRTDSTGVKLGAEIQVNLVTANVQSDPSVIALQSGGFAVAYRSRFLDGSDYAVATRWFDQNGVEALTETVIATTVLGAQTQPEMVQLASGDVIFVWQSMDQDGSGAGIFARAVSADGAVWGSEFQVNTTIEGDQVTPTVLSLPDGGYTVIWRSADQSIYAQRYDASHTAVGLETQLNTESSGALQNPQATVLTNGDMVVSWGTTNDGAGNGIEAQVFQGAYFGTPKADVLSDMAQTNRMYGESGADVLWGLEGDDVIEGQAGADLLIGNKGFDDLFGGLGADTLRGGADNDRLYGGSGVDRMFGGNGRDRLNGGGGDDLLEGGNGRDRFVFSKGGDRDVVTDFELGWDRLLINDLLWQGSLSAQDVIDTFASVADGGTVFEFSQKDQLILRDVTDLVGLVDTIDLI